MAKRSKLGRRAAGLRWGYNLLEAISPTRCIGCLQPGDWFCSECASEFLSSRDVCFGCKKDYDGPRTCPNCRDDILFSGVITGGSYRSPTLKRGVHWLKFRGIVPIASVLAHLVHDRLVSVGPLEYLRTHALLVPIPLHWRRLRTRGYNQSLLLTQHVSEYTGVPVLELLSRNKATSAQAQLSHEDREDNLTNAFGLSGNIPTGCRILILVDDVITTGSTLKSAAQAVLRHHDDLQIWVLAVARG